MRCPLPPQERVLTGRDGTNGHLFKIRHPPSPKGPQGFPDSKDTADSQLIINDAHEHASPYEAILGGLCQDKLFGLLP